MPSDKRFEASSCVVLGRVTLSYASLFMLNRRDGVKFYSTDFCRNINYDANDGFGAQVYKASDSYSASARQTDAGLYPNNMTFRSVMTDDAITEADIRAGLFSGAVVRETLVNHRFPWLGAIREDSYQIGKIVRGDDMWDAETEDISTKMRRTVGLSVTKTCRHNVGDDLCGIDLSLHTDSGTVTAIDSSRPRQIFEATNLISGSHPLAYYRYGDISFTTGANAGLVRECRSWNTDGDLSVFQPFPYDIAVGDAFDIFPGCGNVKSYCKGVDGDKDRPWANNIKNYGGSLYSPGTNEILRVGEGV